jgi:hypothetical protein
MSCSICEKRPPKRFCPAKGEKICAVCCGREREISIDCPADCPHLIAAHRYEAEHRKPVSAEEFPYRDVEVSVEFVYERWPVITGLAATILGFQLQNRDLNDVAATAAIAALAETYRTLGTGIYYERPPEAPLARALCGQLGQFLQEFRKAEAERTGFSALKDSDIFHLLVFLLRLAKQETNGRPRSRAFLDFLRQRFPLPAQATKEASRIIVP